MRKRRKGKRRKPMKTLDKALSILALFLLVFIITMIVIFCVKGSVPDVLIDKVLGAGLWEAIACAAITITKIITGKKDENTEGENDENSVE